MGQQIHYLPTSTPHGAFLVDYAAARGTPLNRSLSIAACAEVPRHQRRPLQVANIPLGTGRDGGQQALSEGERSAVEAGHAARACLSGSGVMKWVRFASGKKHPEDSCTISCPRHVSLTTGPLACIPYLEMADTASGWAAEAQAHVHSGVHSGVISRTKPRRN